MGEHRLDDRLTAVRGPCRVGAHLQAAAPIGQPEAAKVEAALQLDGVLPPSLIPERVLGKGGRSRPELVSHEGDQRFRRALARFQALAGMPQKAQLNGEAKSVDGAPLDPDERQILDAEHGVLGHLGMIDRDGEQAAALLGGQQGAAGHDGLVLMGEAVHNVVAFGSHSERGYRKEDLQELPWLSAPCANGRL